MTHLLALGLLASLASPAAPNTRAAPAAPATPARFMLASLADDARYTEAVRAYEELELDAALASFRALSVDPAISDEERALLLVWIGLTRAQRSELDEAGKAFDAALALHRAVRLPVRAAPKITALFDDALARLPPADAARVEEPATERRAAPPQPEPVPSPPSPDEEGDALPVPAIVAGTAAAVALIGAGIAGVLTTVHYSGAVDSATPQPDAKALVDRANAELVAAIVLGSAGVVLGGAALILFDADETEEQ